MPSLKQKQKKHFPWRSQTPRLLFHLRYFFGFKTQICSGRKVWDVSFEKGICLISGFVSQVLSQMECSLREHAYSSKSCDCVLQINSLSLTWKTESPISREKRSQSWKKVCSIKCFISNMHLMKRTTKLFSDGGSQKWLIIGNFSAFSNSSMHHNLM